jgi:hypothetical protein
LAYESRAKPSRKLPIYSALIQHDFSPPHSDSTIVAA